MSDHGLVTAEVIAEAIFVHLHVLDYFRFHSLIQDQKLLIKVDNAGNRPQAQAVRLLNEELVLLLVGD